MTKHPPNRYTLVADIGGTNTRVALAEGTALLPDTIRKFSNRDFPDLTTVLHGYIVDQGGVNCAGACVAVAGPVRDGVGALTNLDWAIDRKTLAEATQAETVAILNDLQAQGHALGHLHDTALTPVISANNDSHHSAKLVIGIGTGFNIAPVYDTDHERLVPPSECGHSNLPVHNGDDLDFHDFVQNRNGFCAIEDALSGYGLEQIYIWLGQRDGNPAKLAAPDIMLAVINGTDPRAEKSARMFARILGTVVGNQSLIHLPFGGVYLVGGVSRAVAPYLTQFGFNEAFRNMGRFSAFMDNFSVWAIEDDNAALVGCARHLHALG